MSQLEEKKLPNEVKAGLKREEKQKKVDWWKKHWKWVVPSVVAGLVAVIALLLLIVTSIIADIQSRQTLKALKACLSDVEVSEDMTELVVPSNRCNSEEVTRLDLGRFKKLKKIEVGSYSFESVGEVRVSGLSELESVVVGESSFSQKEGRVVVKNCGVLKELRVGDGSFIRFSESEGAEECGDWRGVFLEEEWRLLCDGLSSGERVEDREGLVCELPCVGDQECGRVGECRCGEGLL